MYPFVPSGWVRTRYDNLAKVADLSMPLLVIHGTEDSTVPLSQGEAVFDRAAGPKTLLRVRGAGHNDSFFVGGETYWAAWSEFLASVRSSGSP